jgi:hypothetical protein
VKQFDDTLASQEDSLTVFTTTNFAVFRFCPSLTCEGIVDEVIEAEEGAEEAVEGQVSEDASYQDDMFERLAIGGANGVGCKSNYGEYMVELDDYLALMVRCCGTILFSFMFTYPTVQNLKLQCAFSPLLSCCVPD